MGTIQSWVCSGDAVLCQIMLVIAVVDFGMIITGVGVSTAARWATQRINEFVLSSIVLFFHCHY